MTTRQLQRARYRVVASAALGQIVRLPRSIRRIGARAYATHAYRAERGLKVPAGRHRYINFVINWDVLRWVMKHGRLA